jgi:hypothetical protein
VQLIVGFSHCLQQYSTLRHRPHSINSSDVVSHWWHRSGSSTFSIISRSTSAHSWILSSSTKCALDLPMRFLLPSMTMTIVPWSVSNASLEHPEVCMSTHRVWKPLHQQKNRWYDPAIDHFRERSSKHFCILVSQLQYVVKKDLNQHCMQGELYVQPGHEEPLDAGATRQGREDHWLKKLQPQYQCYPRILHPKHVCKNGNPL